MSSTDTDSGASPSTALAVSDEILRRKPRARPELHEHARFGWLAAVGEQGVFGEGDMHAGAFDFGQRHDAAFQLAFQGAPVVDLLGEVGHAEAGLVEELESNAAGAGQSGGGHFQAELGHAAGWDKHRPAVGNLVADVERLQLLDDRSSVLRREFGEQRPEIALAVPLDSGVDQPADGQQRSPERGALLPGEVVPELDDLLHGVSLGRAALRSASA